MEFVHKNINMLRILSHIFSLKLFNDIGGAPVTHYVTVHMDSLMIEKSAYKSNSSKTYLDEIMRLSDWPALILNVEDVQVFCLVRLCTCTVR